MSNLKNFLFTSESVSEGHPDKVSDRISDMVVDTYLSKDPYARVACETLTTTNKVVLAGEVRGPEIKNDELIEKVADLFCELNLLHPFREGNGRVLRFFFEEMLYSIGYKVSWPPISQREWIDANIAGVNLNLDLLKRIFSQAISEL